MRIPDIELLWWDGCSSTERAYAELREALQQLGIPDAEVRMREIRSDDAAHHARFLGSPTILIDGVDLVPLDVDDSPSLSCRIYHRRDGRISPTPDPDDLREGLRQAAEREEGT